MRKETLGLTRHRHAARDNLASVALAAVLALALATGGARAQTGGGNTVTVDVNAAPYVFAQSAEFTLVAHSERPVVRAELIVSRTGDPTLVAPITLSATRDLSISYTLNLQTFNPRPFSRVFYQWQFTDTSGDVTSTVPVDFFYEDNRFTWQGLGLDAANGLPGLQVRWAAGDREQGAAALEAALAAIPEIERVVGVHLDSPGAQPVRIYLYPRAEDLQSALRLSRTEWVGGHADPQLGTILLAASPDEFGTASLAGRVPHEIAHLAIYSRVRDGYTSVPAWLSEGLATLLEPTHDPALQAALDKAQRDDTLLPLASLCGPFGDERDAATLAYAQSASVVRYLVDRYGVPRVQALLDAYARRYGVTSTACAAAVQEVLFIPFTQLENDWRADLEHRSPGSQAAQTALPWVLLVLAASGVTLFFFSRHKVTWS